MSNQNEQIKNLTNERDTARRMYCSEVDNTRPHGIFAEDIAKSMGWDCYKSDTLSQEVSQEGGTK